MPTNKLTLPEGGMFALSVAPGVEVVVKVHGAQVEYGNDFTGPREGVIKRGQEMTFLESKMLRSKAGSEIEIVHPDPVSPPEVNDRPLPPTAEEAAANGAGSEVRDV